MCNGMACGVPSTLAWPILRDLATAFISHDEQTAVYGMQLAKKYDIESGECGSVGLGILDHLMKSRDDKSKEFR